MTLSSAVLQFKLANSYRIEIGFVTEELVPVEYSTFRMTLLKL